MLLALLRKELPISSVFKNFGIKKISYKANVNVPAPAKRRPIKVNSFSIRLGCCALMESNGR
jgi:hypothetical protein